MTHIILKEESYKIIGLCMEVYSELGMGFQEIVYKDALEFEFRRNKIPCRREKRFDIKYHDRLVKICNSSLKILLDKGLIGIEFQTI
jgi:GxxExxY protein